MATVKNQLSRRLGQVKNGETMVIADRNRPVARLAPLSSSEGAMAALHAGGLAAPPESPFDLAAFLAAALMIEASGVPNLRFACDDHRLTAAAELEGLSPSEANPPCPPVSSAFRRGFRHGPPIEKSAPEPLQSIPT